MNLWHSNTVRQGKLLNIFIFSCIKYMKTWKTYYAVGVIRWWRFRNCGTEVDLKYWRGKSIFLCNVYNTIISLARLSIENIARINRLLAHSPLTVFQYMSVKPQKYFIVVHFPALYTVTEVKRFCVKKYCNWSEVSHTDSINYFNIELECVWITQAKI